MAGAIVRASVLYDAAAPAVRVRAWIETFDRETIQEAVTVATSWAQIRDEEGVLLMQVAGVEDLGGTEYVSFLIPVALAAEHNYKLRVCVKMLGLSSFGDIPLPTVR